MTPQKRTSRCGGYSLVELMIAIGILGVGLAMVSTMLPSGILSNSESNQFAKITAILDNAMPTIRMSLSNTELSTHLADVYGTALPANPGAADPFATGSSLWTYPVYTWPSCFPTTVGNSPIRYGDIFKGDTRGVPLAACVYPVSSDPVIPSPDPGTLVGYPIKVTRPSMLPVFFSNSDWISVTVNVTPLWPGPSEQGAAPSGRDGWMFAVCPVVVNHLNPLPTQAEIAAANDYLFIMFPYRKILQSDVCHWDFRFVRVHVTNNIVDEYWNDGLRWDLKATPAALVPSTDPHFADYLRGLINSPAVNMSNPSTAAAGNAPIRKLVQNGPQGLMLDGGGDDGWWLAVKSMNADVSPAVGCYVFRDRLKD